MPLESMSSQIDEWLSLKDSPEYQKQLNEKVKEVEQREKHYKHLVKVNDVLSVLDLTDEKEEPLRKVLEKFNTTTLKEFTETLERQNPNTIQELTTKSTNEILVFLTSNKTSQTEQRETISKTIKDIEINKQSKENEKNNSKTSKIKSVFTPEILNKFPKIAEQFKKLDTATDKKEVLTEIINLLKEDDWKRLSAIIKDLWWANKNNPKYLEFKNSLVWLDSSFESYFNDLENLNSWNSLNTNNIIWEIEKESWWMVNIDLNSDTPVSKLSLLWSNYSFDEEIDKQELSKLMKTSTEQLEQVQDSFSSLKDFWVSFDTLLSSIKQNWWKKDFKKNLKNIVNNFSKDVFTKLDDVYKEMGIKSDIQLKEYDITSFKDINSPDELKSKIENIKDKFLKIKSQVWEFQTWIIKDYKIEFKELVTRKEEAKEKQLEVLKFMKNSWFDLIPKNITNKIIWELQSNTLIIPWLDLSVKNIDLKNWHFWESGAFIDKEAWLNIEAKRNLIKFINKLITWSIDEPLSVETISNWTSISNPSFLKGKFLEAWIVGNLGWKYSRIVENLKNNQEKK